MPLDWIYRSVRIMTVIDLHRWFVCDSSRGLTVEKASGQTRSLVAKFPQRSVVACSTRISCWSGRTLRTRPRTGVCEPLMPDVVAPKVHQNNCSYVTYLRIHYARIKRGWAITRRILKNHKTVKIGGWAPARVRHLPGAIR